MPHVTVCIPTYNRGHLLRETIDSVLGQTWKDLELILVDDHSSDGTAALAARVNDPRFRYVRNERTLGMVGNWNRCLDLAQGDHIAILHDDDVWRPTFLETLVPILDQDPSLGMVFCAADILDGSGNPLRIHRPWPAKQVFAHGQLFLELLGGNRILCPTVLVRRASFTAAGRFDAHFRYAADWDMWLRIGIRFPVGYIPLALAGYRTGHGSITDRLASLEGEHYRVQEAIAIVEHGGNEGVRRRIPGSRRVARVAQCQWWATSALLSQRLGKTRRSLGEAWRGIRKARLTVARAYAVAGLVVVYAAATGLFGQRGAKWVGRLEQSLRIWRGGTKE